MNRSRSQSGCSSLFDQHCKARHANTGMRKAAVPARISTAQRPRLAFFPLMLLILALDLLVGVPAARASRLNMLAQPSSDIACEQTPFGHRLTLGGDAEMVELVQYAHAPDAELLHEWTLSGDTEPTAPPFEAALVEFWHYYNGASGTLLKAIRADLDGDGRDEIVIAMRDSATGADTLRLGVFRRQPYEGTNIDLFSTWNLNVPFTKFDMAAGDFDGSQDGQQELAVMIRNSSTNNVNVFMLTGNTEGGIAEADNTWSGLWTWQPASSDIGATSLVAGHLLLNGREQMVVVAESDQQAQAGSNRRLNYHLLEFNSQTPALHVAPDSWNIASKSFDAVIGSSFNNSQGGWDINNIDKLKVNAGDVAGNAADELVVDIGFQSTGGSGNNYAVIQFLHHFQVIRDNAGMITSIQFATRPNGERFDSSQLVSQNEVLPDNWDVIVGNVDDKPKEEIVLVRNDYANHKLRLEVYKASVELTASFTYYRTGAHVQFHDNSVGFAVPFTSGHPRWSFGDGQSTDKVNPHHEFSGPGTYTVTLKLRQSIQTPQGVVGYEDHYSLPITIDDKTEHGGGRDTGASMFRVMSRPIYQASYSSDNMLAFGPVRVAVGDMDRDGRVEIMTVARMGTSTGSGSGFLRSLWQFDYDGNAPNDLVGRHMLEQAGSNVPIDKLSVLSLIAADFDGDSVEAILAADCRAVTESKLHQVVWAPPYFQRLQASANRSASFGRSSTNGESDETHFGSFTSTSITGYAGVDLGLDLGGILGGSASARVTANRYHEAATGGLQGHDDSQALTEGYTQSNADGLLSVETNTFYCYMYDVMQADSGLDPDSSLRICEVHDPDTLTSKSPSSPEFWNREYPQIWAEASGGYPPPNWIPVTRDWASVALFKPVHTNASLLNGAEPGLLTDGRFSTKVESQKRYQPYAEVDLGSIRPVTSIRVYAADGKPTTDMTGFRVYTSATPMPVQGLPSGSGVHVFKPDTFDGTIRGRWNIWTRAWKPEGPNVQPGDPLLARYIRLQSPGEGRLDVAEIQVFGDVHQDPPRYPEAVCDPHRTDGMFKAEVWDPAANAFRAIEVHGDILWTGTGPTSGPSWGSDGPYLEGCENDAKLQDSTRNFSILQGKSIGSPGEINWSFTSTSGASTGDTTSFTSSTSVGAEFETTLSAGASFVSGGSKEFASGVNKDYQSTTYWSNGLDMGGSIAGFQPPHNTAHDVNACKYGARPYAYKLVDQSNTGYRHTMYVVDYVVPEESGATAWTRAQLPVACHPALEAGDRIFQSGFELP